MPVISSKKIPIEIDEKTYNVNYFEWGDNQNPTVLCVHGLARNAHDFDFLAKKLHHHFHVIAIDCPGRGQSDWLENKAQYVIPTYVHVINNLIEQLQLNNINWLGTSMGGLIGILFATVYPDKLSRLILNDIGPQIPPAAVKRISSYLAQHYEFKTLTEFEQHLRQIYAPFGNLSDTQWQHMATFSHRILDNGYYTANYDPDIYLPFAALSDETATLWQQWQQINIPIFLIHGEKSDILSADILNTMKQHQTGLISRAIRNVGHAPALMDDEQINLIIKWLNHSH